MKNILNVYLAKIPQKAAIGRVLCGEREAEINLVSDPKVALRKYYVWETLLKGVEHSFGYSPERLSFKKLQSGKWVCGECFFSLSHSGGAVAVSVSDCETGVDIEETLPFFRRFGGSLGGKFERLLSEKEKEIVFGKGGVGVQGGQSGLTPERALELWTKKESVFKCYLSGAFIPKKADTAKYAAETFSYGDYTVSVCGANLKNLRVYVLGDDGQNFKSL